MNIIDYIGKFHPLAVHLPIGILSLFLVLLVIMPRTQLLAHKPVIRILLLISALSATVSSISGYLMANSGSYVGDLVTGHQVLGISLTVLNWALFIWLNYLFSCSRLVYRMVMSLLMFMMVFTGHAGGSITHGADFLTPPPLSSWFSSESMDGPQITMESSAFEAAEMIMKKKCIVCHGESKQKGKLRLDTKDHLLMGGENGNLLGDAQSSGLLLERILLPEDDEDHMPPIERKQLTALEIDFFTWWIEQGAVLDKSLSELSLPESLHPILAENNKKPVNSMIPEKEAQKAAQDKLEALKSLAVIVLPIGSDNNYLSANFVNVLPENLKESLIALTEISQQLIWLNLDYHILDSTSWSVLSQLKELRSLSIKDTNLGDESLEALSGLQELRDLNIVGTKVTSSGLKLLKDLSNLETLFLYQTEVVQNQQEEISALFPQAKIDFGNYHVPILESDTTVLTKENL